MVLTEKQEARIKRYEEMYGVKREYKWSVYLADDRVDDGGYEEWVADFDTEEEAKNEVAKLTKWLYGDKHITYWYEQTVSVTQPR